MKLSMFGLFKKKNLFSTDKILTGYAREFEKMERKFGVISQLPSDLKSESGLQTQYKFSLEPQNHPDFGLCLEGRVETYCDGTYVCAEGFFDSVHENGRNIFMPCENGYVHYYITQVGDDGNLVDSALLVSGRFERCRLVSTNSEKIEVFNQYANLPESVSSKISEQFQILSENNKNNKLRASSLKRIMPFEKSYEL